MAFGRRRHVVRGRSLRAGWDRAFCRSLGGDGRRRQEGACVASRGFIVFPDRPARGGYRGARLRSRPRGSRRAAGPVHVRGLAGSACESTGAALPFNLGHAGRPIEKIRIDRSGCLPSHLDLLPVDRGRSIRVTAPQFGIGNRLRRILGRQHSLGTSAAISPSSETPTMYWPITSRSPFLSSCGLRIRWSEPFRKVPLVETSCSQ